MSVDGSWYVKLGDGDVERVTLDQLDELFQGGRIDENTMVLADGGTEWTKLADLLGLDTPAEPPQAPVAAPVPVQAPLAVQAPQPHAPMTAVAPAPVAMPPQVAARQVAVAPQPVRQVAAVMQPQGAPAARPMAGSPVAPVRGLQPPMMAPPVPVAASVRPVAFDLGSVGDLGDLPFKKSSRKGWVVGALAAVVVAGGGGFFAISQASTSDSTPAPAFAAGNATPPPAPAPEPVAPPTPTTGIDPQAAGPSSIMDPTRRLSDDQKEKLLEADKKAKLHASGGGGGGNAWHAPKEKSTTFTTSGNKYDPLNSNL